MMFKRVSLAPISIPVQAITHLEDIGEGWVKIYYQPDKIVNVKGDLQTLDNEIEQRRATLQWPNRNKIGG